MLADIYVEDDLIVDLRFVAVQTAIMRGNECVATARSKTMAKRIANALNRYIPTREGV